MSLWKYLKKGAIFIAGAAVVVIGIILLLLPGPGLLTIAFGFLILSTEFTWAERHLATIKAKLKAIYDQSKARADKINKK